MSLNFALLMTLDASKAKLELRQIQAEFGKTSGGAKVLATEAVGAGSGLDLVGSKASLVERLLQSLANAQLKVKSLWQGVAGSQNLAAGSTANLVSQFNDIGVMMAAGQSPLQLAIQQGTQITQVFSGMGALGAIKAVGTGLMAMVSPLNLITIGVIGFGAAAVQWLTSAGDSADGATKKVARFADEVKGLDSVLSRIESYDFSKTFDGMDRDADLIKGKFDAILGVVQQVQAEALQAALDKVREATGLQDALDEYKRHIGTSNRPGLSEGFEFMGLKGLNQGMQVMAALNEIEGQNREEILKSADAAAEKLSLLGLMTPAVRDTIASLAEELGLQKQVKSEVSAIKDEHESAAKAAGDLVGKAVDLLTAMREAGAADLSGAFSRAMPAANALLGIASKIGTYLGAIGWLERNKAGGTADLASQYSQYGAGRVAGEQASKLKGDLYGGNYTPEQLGTAKVKSAGGGGGAKAAKDESAAIKDLIASMREEADVARESDPVKTEMLKHRKVLATATAAERAEVEQLIRAEQQLKAVRAVEDYASQSMMSALDMIFQKGKSINDVLKSVLSSLIQVGIQALITGQGPLAGILGIKGGIFSGVFSGGGGGGTGSLGLPMPFADGGLITGAGGPRDDTIHIRGSAGEFMMNGKATAKWRPVLERMNAGSDAPGFADGGFIGGRSGGGSGGGRGGDIIQNITINNPTGNSEIRDMVKEGVGQGMKAYDRNILPSRVRTIFSEGAKVTG